jgi:DNA-binding transcriptional LysR family regulator
MLIIVDLRRLGYFVMLAETLHFRRAAAQLHLAQPALSQQIRVLEQELGAQLFERTNRRVELTPAGHALLPEARALLAQAGRASTIAARVARGELGELRIGFTSAAALTEAVTRIVLAYRQQWPGVHLRIDELTTSEQVTAMIERRLDFAFVRGAEPPSLPPNLRAVLLFEDALVAALPPRHPLAASAGPLAVRALADEPFVMYPQASGTGIHAQVLSLCQRANFAPRVVQEARSAATIVGLVAAGLGVSLVPASFRGIGGNGVVYRPLRDRGAKSAMWLVVRTGVVSAQERQFLEAAGLSDAAAAGHTKKLRTGLVKPPPRRS